MRYLLDTHAIIWYVWADPRLPIALRDLMDSEECFYSITSLWEIAIKQSLGKLKGDFTIADLDGRCRVAGFGRLPIRPNHLERIKTLPNVHRDPFDRLLVAQAQEEDLSIITNDRLIPQYPVSTIWS